MLHALLHLNLNELVTTLGYAGIIAIIFAETGIFVGCFFPGDSLLFTAGMLAAKGFFNVQWLIPLAIVAAIVGYAVGYWFGDKLGHALAKRPDGFFWKRKYLDSAHDFYSRHGGQAMILCRLVPIVRTFCPIIAGMGRMPMRRYMVYNVVGALIWVPALTLLGYFIGAMVPNAHHFILPIVLGIVVLSVLPGVVHYVKNSAQPS